MKRFLRNIIIIVYAAVAITVTFCLLNYNKYKVTEIGSKTLVIIDDTSLEPEFKKGSLVIVDRDKLTGAKEGDKIFFYDSKENIKLGEANQINKYSGAGTSYVFDGGRQVPEDDVIGPSADVKVYEKIGGILSLLESKWGFLFAIIFPSLLAFLNEIVQLLKELQGKDNRRDYRDYDRSYSRDYERDYDRDYDRRTRDDRDDY